MANRLLIIQPSYYKCRGDLTVAYFNVTTSDKGTEYYDRMLRSDRILNAGDIGRWPGQACHIRPSFCSPQELERQVQEMYRDFYSLPSMCSRLPWRLTLANIASWVLNFSQRHMARTILDNMNFGNY